MYAYCCNNPIAFTDSSGQFPVLQPGLLDRYFIHRKVQKDCQKKTGWEIEVKVEGAKGNGRLDLYDKSKNSYYEVKSKGAAYTTVTKRVRKSTRDQMEKYDVAGITDKRFPELENVVPTRGTDYVKGTTQYFVWDIEYEYKEPGLIVYTLDQNSERTAAVVAGIVSIVLFATTGYAPTTSFSPGFAF